MTARRALPWIIGLAVLAFIGWKLHTSHFDWHAFAQSWRTADWRLLLAAVAVVYASNLLRAMRWAVFLKPAFKQTGIKPVGWLALTGSQFIGFTGLAIFGRIGELIRPLLVARRTGLTFSSQVAVVTVERVFDLGAFALVFSLNLLLSPGLQTLPYHELFHKVGFAIAALTLILCAFVAGVRLAGNLVARLVGRVAGMISASAAASASEKILLFRDGLNVLDGAAGLLGATALSLLLWAAIALSYVLVMKAFPPPVHGLTIADALVLLGFSAVGSIVQLPGGAGGAQVGTITALTLLFGIPNALAVSAGLILWLVTTMAVIPAGLIFARIEGVSLRQVARRSEAEEVSVLETL